MTPGFYDLTVLLSVLFVLSVVGLAFAWFDVEATYWLSCVLRSRAMAKRAADRSYRNAWRIYRSTAPTMRDLESFTNFSRLCDGQQKEAAIVQGGREYDAGYKGPFDQNPKQRGECPGL